LAIAEHGVLISDLLTEMADTLDETLIMENGFHGRSLAVLTQNGPLPLRNKINASESDLNQAFTLCIASANAAHG
jgi:hypothetical protein